MQEKITNVRIAGLGGMGVLKASLILGELLFECGYDVKKAEVHGMSQRGGSISSDVRFGKKVVSPMIPDGKIDFLLSLAPEWSDTHIQSLAPDGVVLSANSIDTSKLRNAKAITVAVLGMLSKKLDIPREKWLEVLKKFFPQKLHDANESAFILGENSI